MRGHRFGPIHAVLLLCAGVFVPAAPDAAGPADARGVFSRVVVLGASVSAGFGLEAEAGAPVTLADILDAAIRVDHGPIRSGADTLFFLFPEEVAEKSVGKAHAEKPTLAVAVDFLFWFAYGGVGREEERLELLEKGLAFLERLPCPCIVGTIPDMTPAVGLVLQREQVPAPATFPAVNGRIRKWAAGRANVVVLDLARLVEAVRRGEALRVGDRVLWPEGTSTSLLQRDRLHTTLEGTSCVVIAALEELARARGDVPRDAFIADPRAVAKAVRASAAAARESAPAK